jgi:tight adherence protein C
MLIVIALLTLFAIAALTLLLANALPGRNVAVTQGLERLQRAEGGFEAVQRRRRHERSEKLKGILEVFGGKMEEGRRDTSAIRLFLIQGGYAEASAVQIYWATRVALGFGLAIVGLLLAPALDFTPMKSMMTVLYLGAMGWIIPVFYVRRRIKKRQKEIQLALPDMLDLLVVCVEAGLGMNQALLRVADEIDHVSPVTAEYLGLVNLQIRAGTPREEALQQFAERTGLQDVKSLVSMLVQTERFGTSVANALRIHADTMRTKRRQRAEEAAAKTTIKLVFPLVLCIFPAMMIVILTPAVIGLIREFSQINAP